MLSFYHNLRPFQEERESAFQMTTLTAESTLTVKSSGTTATSRKSAVSSTSVISSPAVLSALTAAVKPKTPTDSSTPLVGTPTCESTPMAVSREEQKLINLIGPYPYDAPPGFHWVPNGWRLEKTEASFEQLFLEKVKSNPSKGSTEKRQKLDFRGKVNLIFMRNIQKFQWFWRIGAAGHVCYPIQAISFISKQGKNTGSKVFCI